MIKILSKFFVKHLIIFSFVSFILFSSSITQAQWNGQADNLPGNSDSEMLTIVLVAVGVVAVGVAAYLIINSANEDSVKSDSTRSDTTSQIITTPSYASVIKLISNYERIKDLMPVQITAGLRRDNFSISGKQLYLGVKVNF